MVRLLDAEGRKWGDGPWHGEGPAGDRPPRELLFAVSPKIMWTAEPVEPTAPLEIRYVRFALERRDGGGTYVYRRESPLW